MDIEFRKAFSEEVTCELNTEGCTGVARQRDVAQSVYVKKSSLYKDPEVGESLALLVSEVGRVVQERVGGSWLDKQEAEYGGPL